MITFEVTQTRKARYVDIPCVDEVCKPFATLKAAERSARMMTRRFGRDADITRIEAPAPAGLTKDQRFRLVDGNGRYHTRLATCRIDALDRVWTDVHAEGCNLL